MTTRSRRFLAAALLSLVLFILSCNLSIQVNPAPVVVEPTAQAQVVDPSAQAQQDIAARVQNKNNWTHFRFQTGIWYDEVMVGGQNELIFAEFHDADYAEKEVAFVVTIEKSAYSCYYIYRDGSIAIKVEGQVSSQPIHPDDLADLEKISDLYLPVYPDILQYWLDNR